MNRSLVLLTLLLGLTIPVFAQQITIGDDGIVSRLVDGVMGVGTHTVQFGGENIPSGVYIYTLKTEGYTSVRKMMLVK